MSGQHIQTGKHSIWKRIRQFLTSEDGPTAVEYAVILGMIVAVVIGSVNSMAHATANSFEASANSIAAAMGQSDGSGGGGEAAGQ